MSLLWTDHEKWQKMCDRKNCPVCNQSAPPSDLITIEETEYCWLEAHPRVALRGTCYIMPTRHAVELCDLSDDDAMTVMRYLMLVTKVLKEVTGAAKINTEIHGNSVPHLHIHLFPRYAVGDRFGDGPINPHEIEPAVYEEGEFAEFIDAMRTGLERHARDSLNTRQ